MDGVESAIYISVLLKELHPQLNNNRNIHGQQITLWCIMSQKYVSDKHLRIDIGALKQMLRTKEIDKIH